MFAFRGRSRSGEVRTRRKPSLGSMLRLGGRPNRICEFWRDRRKAAGGSAAVDF
jgi:hypothetical protein